MCSILSTAGILLVSESCILGRWYMAAVQRLYVDSPAAAVACLCLCRLTRWWVCAVTWTRTAARPSPLTSAGLSHQQTQCEGCSSSHTQQPQQQLVLAQPGLAAQLGVASPRALAFWAHLCCGCPCWLMHGIVRLSGQCSLQATVLQAASMLLYSQMLHASAHA